MIICSNFMQAAHAHRNRFAMYDLTEMINDRAASIAFTENEKCECYIMPPLCIEISNKSMNSDDRSGADKETSMKAINCLWEHVDLHLI